MRSRWRLAVIALLMGLSTGCDQAAKRIATAELQFSPPRSYAGDLLRIQYVENRGAFLSLGAGLTDDARRILFIAGVGILLVGLLIFALLSSRLKPLTVVGLALVLGGGVSNWADRVMHGSVVVDFLNVGVGPLRTGFFNVADVLIGAGVVLLIAMARHGRHAVGATEHD